MGTFKKLLILLFLINLNVFAQDNNVLPQDQVVKNIERFILEKQQDSASYYLSNLKFQNEYGSILKKIVEGNEMKYDELKKFIVNTTNNSDIEYFLVSNFINRNAKQPENRDSINRDYATIKIDQITRLRNDGDLDKSTLENEKLLQYIDSFDQNDREVILIKAQASFHNAVLAFIQRDLDKVKNILSNTLSIAEKYDDINLKIGAQYYLSDVYVVEGKLQEFIDINEQNLILEKELQSASPYHNAIIIYLIDAYAYQGGNDKRVQELLNELYDDPESRKDTYSLYAKYLSRLPPNSSRKKEVYDKFDVTNAKEFAELSVSETKGVLNANDFYFVLIENSASLETDGFLKEAIRYQEQAVEVNRKVYSEDLSKSLAAFQTEQAVKIKDIEIENEKKRSQLYVIVAILIGLLLIASLFFLFKTRKQSLILKEKNSIIDESLKEKELLVKEIHHRVKNNFQIVSSLLELQSKGIEDEKAKQLAQDGKNRVKSMALIHQRLYQNEDGLISFDNYIKELIKEISAMYNTKSGVKTTISVADVSFDVDTAIPLGLIINELITNAYKYAFAKADSPQLNITLVENKENYSLTIKDNGAGMDPDFNFTNAKSLGLRLVKNLTKQLQGKVEIESVEGTLFTILFKDTLQRKMVD